MTADTGEIHNVSPMPSQNQQPPIPIRLPPELLAEIKASAEFNERSLNGEITYMLKMMVSLMRRRNEAAESEAWYRLFREEIAREGGEWK